MATKSKVTRANKPKGSAKKSKIVQQITIPGPETALWVVSMHNFFNVHGYYRSEDVLRVLGDPSKPFTSQEQKDGLLTGSLVVKA